MVDLLFNDLKECLLVNRQIAVDESMIKLEGRSSFKQYMPEKNDQTRIHGLDTYRWIRQLFEFWLYTGKGDSVEKISEHVLSATCDYRCKDHILYMDDFFNNVPLMEELKKNGIQARTVNPCLEW